MPQKNECSTNGAINIMDETATTMRQLIDTNIHLCIPWYLMASYAYYKEDDPIISDAQFDWLVKRTMKDWDDIEHMHKHCILYEDLQAGSFLGEYPSRIEGALKVVRDIYKVKPQRGNSRRYKRGKNS